VHGCDLRCSVFLCSFIFLFFSSAVFETSLLRVVDTKMLASSVAASGVNLPSVTAISFPMRGSNNSCNEGSSDPLLAFSRRMEFVQTPRLAQTEVYIDADMNYSQSWDSFDANDNDKGRLHPRFFFSVLHMAAHRVIGNASVEFLMARQARYKELKQEYPQRVAVIGAGCCALPAFLLSYSNSLVLTVDAVEPEPAVIEVAEKYFGMVFDKERGLSKHLLDGASFLESAATSKERYDLIVVDAFSEGSPGRNGAPCGDSLSALVPTLRTAEAAFCVDSHSSTYQYAPPLDLLCQWDKLSTVLCGGAESACVCAPTTHHLSPASASASHVVADSNCGLLLINAWGPDSWIDFVKSKVIESQLFCEPLVLSTASSRVDGMVAPAEEGADNRNFVLATMPLSGSKHFKLLTERLLSLDLLIT
jgi:hypothetical protein